MPCKQLMPLSSKLICQFLFVVAALQLAYRVDAVWNGNLQFKADGTFKMVMFTDLHMAENNTAGAWDDAKDNKTMQASTGHGRPLISSITGSNRFWQQHQPDAQSLGRSCPESNTAACQLHGNQNLPSKRLSLCMLWSMLGNNAQGFHQYRCRHPATSAGRHSTCQCTISVHPPAARYGAVVIC